MRKLLLVVLCLLVGLVAGLLLRPDDGTQVSISPAESGSVVSGANHAKPLPRVSNVDADLVRDILALSAVLLLAGLLAVPGAPAILRPGDDPRPQALRLAHAGARRGPPARA